MEKKVISRKNLPIRNPFLATMVLGLLLDRFNAPGWAWGASMMFAVLVWIAFFHEWFAQVEVDVL